MTLAFLLGLKIKENSLNMVELAAIFAPTLPHFVFMGILLIKNTYIFNNFSGKL